MPKAEEWVDTKEVIEHIAQVNGKKPITRMTLHRYMVKGKKNRSGGRSKLRFKNVAGRRLTTIENVDRFLAEVTA